MSSVIIDPAKNTLGSKPRGEPFFYRLVIIVTAVVFSGFLVNGIVNFDDFERSSPWIIIHGINSVAWFLLLINQLRLVRAGNLAAHRAMGTLSVIVALSFLVSGLFLIADLYQHLLATGQIDLTNTEDRLGVAADLGATTLQFALFTTLFLLGLANRKNPIQHKRFMVATSIQMAPAALSRWLAVLGQSELFVLPIMLIFYGSILVHDWRRDRRLHWATLVSLGLFMLLPLSFFFVFTQPWWSDLLIDLLGDGSEW